MYVCMYVYIYIFIYGGFHKWGYGWFIMENATKRMVWAYPYFRKPPYVYFYLQETLLQVKATVRFINM